MKLRYGLLLLLVPVLLPAQQAGRTHLEFKLAQERNLPFSSGVNVGDTLYVAGTTGVVAEQSSAESALRQAFVGKQVVLKLDMPGTQKGVDLRFDRDDVMDWNDYSGRIRQFGLALRRGDRATVTNIVVKHDLIEFHLDGGGYGTVHDDTGSVTARIVPKSDAEERMEKDLKNETDPGRRRDLQRRIDREESRRNFLQSQENAAAMVADQLKQQEVAARRLRGGSRFNLRWNADVPADQLRPKAVRDRLADFVDFDGGAATAVVPASPELAAPAGRGDSATPIYRGMKLEELRALLGPGQLLSQETSEPGVVNQELLFQTTQSRIYATLVNGALTRYVIESR